MDELNLTLAGFAPTREEYERAMRVVRALTEQLAQMTSELQTAQAGWRQDQQRLAAVTEQAARMTAQCDFLNGGAEADKKEIDYLLANNKKRAEAARKVAKMARKLSREIAYLETALFTAEEQLRDEERSSAEMELKLKSEATARYIAERKLDGFVSVPIPKNKSNNAWKVWIPERAVDDWAELHLRSVEALRDLSQANAERDAARAEVARLTAALTDCHAYLTGKKSVSDPVWLVANISAALRGDTAPATGAEGCEA